jgi:hypothetical protein
MVGLLIWILVLASVQRSTEPYRGFYQYGILHERSDTKRILILRVVLSVVAIYFFGLHGVWLLLSTLVPVLLYVVFLLAIFSCPGSLCCRSTWLYLQHSRDTRGWHRILCTDRAAGFHPHTFSPFTIL